MSTWRELFREAQRALPRNATPRERGAATRRAAALYRGRGQRAAPRSRSERNPRPDILRMGLIAGAAVAAWKLFLNRT